MSVLAQAWQMGSAPTHLAMPNRLEFLLPFAIFGSCTALCGLATQPKLAKAREDKVRLDLLSLRQASKLWLRSHQTFPTTEEGLEAMVREKILEDVPRDPWGRPYLYEVQASTCRIFTLGEDGVRGGSDEDQDIFLWLSLPLDSSSLRASGPKAWPPLYRPHPGTSRVSEGHGALPGFRARPAYQNRPLPSAGPMLGG